MNNRVSIWFSNELFTLSTGLSTSQREKAVENSGLFQFEQKNSTVLCKTVEFFIVYIILIKSTFRSFVENFRGEYPLVVILHKTVGIHLQGVFLPQFLVQQKALTFLCLAEIANGKFLYDVSGVEDAGHQVINPVHAPGVVHVTVPVQIGKAHAALLAAAGVQNH